MRTLKILSLAAIAALGLMAFVGAGTASATTKCKTKGKTCPTGWHYAVTTSTHITSVKTKITPRLTSPAGTTVATCEKLTVTSSQKETSAVKLPETIHTIDWTNCTQTVDNIATGSLTIIRTGENEAEVQAVGVEVTVVLSGLSCTYTTGEGTRLGTFVGGKEPTMSIETKVKKSAGSFTCPTEPTWDAEVQITEPTEVFPTE